LTVVIKRQNGSDRTATGQSTGQFLITRILFDRQMNVV